MHLHLKDTFLGCNLAALSHLFQGRLRQFHNACLASQNAAQQALNPKDKRLIELAQIPTVELADIVGQTHPLVVLPVIVYEDGMLPPSQAVTLLAILLAEAPKEVLEIGTFMGHTSRLMAENLPDAVIHTVDLPLQVSHGGSIPKDDFHLIARRNVGREFQNHPCASRIRQHLADTATWDFHNAGHPTFCFIDGSHTYAYCKNDSEKFLQLCNGHGTFLWHDCDANHPGVVQFLLQWRSQGRNIVRIAGTPLAYWKANLSITKI